MAVPVLSPPKNDGRFKKGERRSPETEFRPGQHWRPPRPFRERAYLLAEYVGKKRSTGEIAAEYNVTGAAIIHWLRRHQIPRRDVSGARSVKYWGQEGAANPMFGKRGVQHPGWKGGHTPERQSLYSSGEWRRASRLVMKRDRRLCQRCQHFTDRKHGAHIHHIVPFGYRPFRAEPTNLVLLCKFCHRWVHSPANTARTFILPPPTGAQAELLLI